MVANPASDTRIAARIPAGLFCRALLTSILLSAIATETIGCTISNFLVTPIVDARVWKERGKIHFAGPGVTLSVTLSCPNDALGNAQIGWVQNVQSWTSERAYEHGLVAIEAPLPPIWDGGNAPYPWYSNAARAKIGDAPVTITLADVPGGEVDLQLNVPTKAGMPFKTKLVGITKSTSLQAAIVLQKSPLSVPVVLGVVNWSQGLRLKVSKADTSRPDVEVESEWIKAPADIDTNEIGFKIPDQSAGKFQDVYRVVWTTDRPELESRVTLSRNRFPQVVKP